MKLYHGTAGRHLKSILAEGIKPRSKKARGNWHGTVESNPYCVYLTNCYAIRFAANAARDHDQLAIIEVDTGSLTDLVPDEDYLEQASRGGGPAPNDKSMKYRTRWYRRRLREYAHYWRDSIDGMGTCGHWGPVPASAITGVRTLDWQEYLRLVWETGHDPMISTFNYRFCGPKYRNSIKALFGYELEPDPLALSQENFAKLMEMRNASDPD